MFRPQILVAKTNFYALGITLKTTNFYSSLFLIRNNPVKAVKRPSKKAESVAVPVFGKTAVSFLSGVCSGTSGLAS